MEADSLNCIVLGEDVNPEMPEWDIFIKEVRKEITVKSGQKCTAIRQDFVLTINWRDTLYGSR